MDDLEYSAEAKNVLSDFHEVDLMFFVEGDDDVPFWEFLLAKLSVIRFRVESVGGKHNLKKYIDEILSNKINGVVGLDLDYSFFENVAQHPRIIKTYGYSIENTIISGDVIFDAIRALGRLSKKDIDLGVIEEWFSAFKRSVSALIFLDIESVMRGVGIEVLGSSCHRFLKNKGSHELCEIKIDRHLKSLNLNISVGRRAALSRKIRNFDRVIFDFVRGHFLFSWIMNMVSCYIKKYRDKFHLSIEAFFGSLLLAFEGRFNESHEHYSYYRNSLSALTI